MNLVELQSLYDLTDRTVLVTGGTGVLGLEIARTLVECSANVVILSRNQERGRRAIRPGRRTGNEYITRGKSNDPNRVRAGGYSHQGGWG